MIDPRLVETTLSRFTKALVRAVAPTSIQRGDLLARAGLGERALDAPLDDASARTLWTIGPALTGDPDFGLHFAEAAALQDLGLVGYLGRASETLGDACLRVAAHERLFKDETQLLIEVDERGATIVDIPPAARAPWPRHLAEAVLASWVIWPRRWSSDECRPTRVRFQHERPEGSAALERLFACPIEFARSVNAIEFTPQTWSIPLATSDALLARYLESSADEQSRQLERDPFLARIERLLTDLLPSGEVGVPRVARALGLSSRSLHRRLSEHGVTYRDLLDELRRRRAMALLERQQHTLSEVAFLVGFSDPSGLRRAVRRWSRERVEDTNTHESIA
ncbi:AraC family transcriptional regulator ligand-binding domain-containing protein [Nannocystaceae bacterium ST9]